MTAGARATRPWEALVLAGSRSASDPVAQAAGVSAKAFAEVGGRPMLETVARALLDSERFGAIRVAMADDSRLAEACPRLADWMDEGRVKRVRPEATPAETVLRALEREGEAPCMVTTGDHPFLRAETVATFLDAVDASDAEVAAALTDAEAIRARYPGIRRTALDFRDGAFTGCNLFACAGERARNVARFWVRLEGRRKSPLRLAWALGPKALAEYRFGRLTLRRALDQLERKTGAKLHAVTLLDPESGIDVDTPDDLRLAREIAAARSE